MNNDTQPLVEPTPNDWWEKEKARALAAIKWGEAFGSRYPDEKQAYLQKWGSEAEQEYKQEEPPVHIHGPFTFLLNQNHNALRGCVTCGAAWVGVMAGSPDDIRWHAVAEVPEEEG